jgi:hypothetical protein
MSIGGDDLLTLIENESPKLGQYLRRFVVPAIQNLGTNTGASPNGYVAPPDTPQGIIVNKQGAENVQITIQHNSPVPKGIEYFTEVDTDPSFPRPRVEHHGASRAPASTIFLPTNSAGGSPHTYYFRTYAQLPGSQPSKPFVYPLGVTMTGATNADHTPSTGSGTALPNGTQGGSGWGKVLQRPAPAAKRVVNGS